LKCPLSDFMPDDKSSPGKGQRKSAFGRFFVSNF
jgi:hypothetical protein